MMAPGSTIGVLGSGQLGRMMAVEAQRMGYRVHVYSPDTDSPAGQVSCTETTGAYDDHDALCAFAGQVDVVTFEFENIPLPAVHTVEKAAPVLPNPHVLQTTQNRLREKNFLQQAGLAVAPFCAVSSAADMHAFMSRDNSIRPIVIKSAENGYDGKGQARVSHPDQADEAYSDIGCTSAIAEDLVDFECELSVIGSRSRSGEIRCFGPILNHHVNHILDVSISQSDGLPMQVCRQATEMARTVLESLQVVGVLTLEMFLTSDGRLLVNELAPRPHNSGHLTIEGAETSQFEQQVRAVCGLPLGPMNAVRPAAMANLLGEHLPTADSAWAALADNPRVRWHLYGKRGAATGRKMGHLTATADSAAEAEEHVRSARRQLLDSPGSCSEPIPPGPNGSEVQSLA